MAIYIQNKQFKKKLLNDLLLNMKKNENKCVTHYIFKYQENNKKYIKNIYFIITDEMKENLKNQNITQFFVDVTFYSKPTYTKKYKILIIIGFDIEENKSKLVAIILLENENLETFNI